MYVDCSYCESLLYGKNLVIYENKANKASDSCRQS